MQKHNQKFDISEDLMPLLDKLWEFMKKPIEKRGIFSEN